MLERARLQGYVDALEAARRAGLGRGVPSSDADPSTGGELVAILELELQRIRHGLLECFDALRQIEGHPQPERKQTMLVINESLALLKTGCEQIIRLLQGAMQELASPDQP